MEGDPGFPLGTDTLEYIDAATRCSKLPCAQPAGQSFRITKTRPEHRNGDLTARTQLRKTVLRPELLSLMALSGLPVPTKSARSFYQSILADIGDHQSLAEPLNLHFT
jgi:hypothetical protein